ncbi:MAG: sugar ABC transporter permease [Nitrososphaeria archaeon]
MSFSSWNGILGVPIRWIGLFNFGRLLIDPDIINAIELSLIYMILTTLGTVLVGLVLASLLDMRVRGWNTFRAIFYLSVLLPAIVTGRLFVTMYNPNVGLIQPLLTFIYGLVKLHAPVIYWLSDAKIVIYSIILKDIWQYAGFPMIIFIAGFSTIPVEVSEAALVEGATEWQIFRHIKLPLIRNVFAIALTLQLIFSFKVFDTVWTMTEGGPGTSTQVLAVYLYKEAFIGSVFGYSAAIAVLMILIIFPIAIASLKLSRFGEI